MMLAKIETLRARANELDYNHDCGMKAVPNKESGPGFFPGCSGLFSKQSDTVSKPVMVLGQDFGNEDVHAKLDGNGEVDKNTTWKHLKTLLADIKIDPDLCFFTNAYMGLRTGSSKSTGPSPASLGAASNFATGCRDFFKDQLRVIQPELVLVMGRQTAKFVALTFPVELGNWMQTGSLATIFQDPTKISHMVSFEGAEIQFVFVLHPSFNVPNRQKIWPEQNGGNEETAIIRDRLAAFYQRHNVAL